MIPYHTCTTTHTIDPKALPCVAKHLYAAHIRAQGWALQDLTLTIKRGVQVALVGPNGAGKSTLLKAVSGLLKISKGSLQVFGHQAGACQHQVAYLPQQSTLDWSFPMTLEGFILTGRYVHLGWLTKPTASDHDKLDAVLDLLKLTHLRKRNLNELSGGERQRALLARTLLHDAELLLLDEPLNAVDTHTCGIIRETLHALKIQGKTVIMATHHIDRLQADFDAAVFLSEGRLCDYVTYTSSL